MKGAGCDKSGKAFNQGGKRFNLPPMVLHNLLLNIVQQLTRVTHEPLYTEKF